MMRGLIGGLLVVELFVGVALADDTLDVRRLLPQQAPIHVPAPGGLVRLPLPTPILAACRPDLSDLRVFDRDGREVPFFVDAARAPTAATTAFPTTLLAVRQQETARPPRPPLRHEEYELGVEALPAGGAGWELVLDTTAVHFVRQVQVAVAVPDGTIVPLLTHDPIFRLQQPLRERLRVSLPPVTGNRLVVTLTGDDGPYLEPRFHLERQRVVAPRARSGVALAVVDQRREGTRTIIDLTRPAGVVPDALRLETVTPSFSRSVIVRDLRANEAPIIAQGDLFRITGPTVLETRELSITPATGDRLRIEIDDHDEPALTSVRVMAVTVPPVVVVSLAANDGNVPGATLYFGGHRTEAPRYDLSTLAAAAAARGDHTAADLMDQLREPSALTVASLGTVTDNPRFGATPLLQFAMRPGAAIDVRGYSHRRPFTVPPSRDGLSLLALEPDDLAIAADDLSDVRVVDAHGQQWSYLLVPNATATWTTLPVGRPQTTKRVSRYKLTLPSRPLRSDRALVEIATPFFDRAYRLVTRDAAGTEQVLAEGRLSRRATHPVPLLIPLPPTRCYGLVLEIEDGDDAPLPISGLQLRLPGPTLYLAAPAGEYALLVGDPMAVTPSYELEQVRDLVLATTGVVAQPHALEANPTFAATARLTHSGRTTVMAQRWLVWAALLAAVAAVTMVTLRSARQKL